MSGTSADSIDAALVEFGAGVRDYRLVAFCQVPLAPALREMVFRLFRPETGPVDLVCRANFALGEAFAQAALRVIAAAGLRPEEVDLIGSHGQTVWHAIGANGRAEATLQIGEPAVIAERTGITTIANFRPRDIAAGGEGAPLVSLVDDLLFSHKTLGRAVQNIGGIANVTALPSLRQRATTQPPLAPLAFDTGPGNMLIDYAASRATAGRLSYDQDGQIATAGRVNPALLERLMAHPYLQQPPPKTTGRELFGVQFGRAVYDQASADGIPPADIVATLTAFTAQSIADAYRRFIPYPVDEVIVGGGGAKNPALMRQLTEWLTPARLLSSDDLGLPAVAKEAVSFAILAYETWHNRPGNLPSCTGASHPVVLGQLVPGRCWPPPPQPGQT